MFLKLLASIAVYCYLSVMIKGLTIREVSAKDDTEVTTTSSVTDSSYRKSVAKIKETPYRVPEHLQFIPKGFIYEDADDVIHVIDPPKHFEELKRIMQHQEQHRLENLRPIALRERRPKPKIIQTILPAKHKGETIQRKPAPPEFDLHTQEAQHLPLEILASVRKTENYLRKYKPKLPSVKHRLKSRKIQTVIWEQQQEQQQFQQSQEQRVQGVREQIANRRHFNKKRFRREATGHEYKPLKGEELLTHISDLIKNASFYLKQSEHFEEYNDSDVESTTLQGEIFVGTTSIPRASSAAFHEDTIVKILENSVKATHVIMQQIKAQTNLTTITQKCDYLKVTYPNHIQNLQNQIKCMQNFIRDINQTQQQKPQLPGNMDSEKQYGERLEVRKTKDLEHKPFLVAPLTSDYIDDTAPSPVNSSLIYDDVMTTIRNMLHSQNLQSIDDAPSWEDSLSDTSFAYEKPPPGPMDFDNLQEYLSSLQAIVTNLPKFDYKSLNLQEIEGGGSTIKYYFINPQGTIYSLPQPFRKDATLTTPTTIIHHQFPDLPAVTEYLRNATSLPPPSSKLAETI